MVTCNRHDIPTSREFLQLVIAPFLSSLPLHILHGLTFLRAKRSIRVYGNRHTWVGKPGLHLSPQRMRLKEEYWLVELLYGLLSPLLQILAAPPSSKFPSGLLLHAFSSVGRKLSARGSGEGGSMRAKRSSKVWNWGHSRTQKQTRGSLRKHLDVMCRKRTNYHLEGCPVKILSSVL